MSEDIEPRLRAALKATEITEEKLRRPTMPPPKRSNARSWAIAATATAVVAVVSVVMLVFNNSSIPTAAQAYVGYKWQFTTITYAENQTPIPADFNAYARFSADGLLLLSDSVNVTNCEFKANDDGFRVRDKGSTMAGYGGSDPTRLLVIDAVRALASAGQVAATVTGDSLTLIAGEYRITLTRNGMAGENKPPPATGTR